MVCPWSLADYCKNLCCTFITSPRVKYMSSRGCRIWQYPNHHFPIPSKYTEKHFLQPLIGLDFPVWSQKIQANLNELTVSWERTMGNNEKRYHKQEKSTLPRLETLSSHGHWLAKSTWITGELKWGFVCLLLLGKLLSYLQENGYQKDYKISLCTLGIQNCFTRTTLLGLDYSH